MTKRIAIAAVAAVALTGLFVAMAWWFRLMFEVTGGGLLGLAAAVMPVALGAALLAAFTADGGKE